ncbi:hypothetical protein RFI_04219 [Reticulomyxa filosa]|uniref:Uncharacterized protein n=1 Tax=Reticulomyxa filosa TaxID=46433 RepID=X6P3Z3_RETFI|nr:hypothetical protein RFI_04219 [Reticulomyxa filosa]|eukprot:ETO32896.1 hypothetical protein RFI_04219 [Reticulomyxa filosa]
MCLQQLNATRNKNETRVALVLTCDTSDVDWLNCIRSIDCTSLVHSHTNAQRRTVETICSSSACHFVNNNNKTAHQYEWNVSFAGQCIGNNIGFDVLEPYVANAKTNRQDTKKPAPLSYDVIFRVGGCMDLKTMTYRNECEGLTLSKESSVVFEFPKMFDERCWANCVYSHKHGLIVTGGEKSSGHLSTVELLPLTDSCLLFYFFLAR